MEANTDTVGEGTPGIGRAPVRLLLRPEEGAEAIGVSRARFYELLAQGQIKSIKIGRSRRVPITELRAFITAQLAAQTA